MRTKNIVFSTTRQWNPGDEFILIGCINLLKKITTFNAIIYNKHPQVRYLIGWKRKSLNSVFKFFFRVPLFSPFLDNSLKPTSRGTFVDLVVFAGSPSWYGEVSKDLYHFILKNEVPTLFLGIGMGEPISIDSFKPYEIEVLKKANLVITRDKRAEKLLQSFGAIQQPCPALFSSVTNKLVYNVKRVGLIYATHRTPKDNRVNDQVGAYIQEYYKRLLNIIDHIEFEIVCHYFDELEYASEEFADLNIRYSYDSSDYKDIYNSFDFVIGSRVHGLGLSASLGIPGIMISHDIRSDTVKGFLSTILKTSISIDENLEATQTALAQAEKQSELIVQHKRKTEEIYLNQLIKINALTTDNS